MSEQTWPAERWPTAAEWLPWFLALDEVEQLERAASIISDAQTAWDCWARHYDRDALTTIHLRPRRGRDTGRRGVMSTCTKSGCQRRTFMDTDRCFDHQKADAMFKGWFIFVAIIQLAILGALGWAGYELVTWVTSK